MMACMGWQHCTEKKSLALSGSLVAGDKIRYLIYLSSCWERRAGSTCRGALIPFIAMSGAIFDASDVAARRACLSARPASARRHKGGCSSSEVARAASANKIRAEDWAFAAARNGYPLSAMGVGRPPPTGMECLCRPLAASGVASDGRPSLRPGSTPRPHTAREARAPERRTPRHAAPRHAAPEPTVVVVSRRTGAYVSLAVAPTVDAPPASPVVALLVQQAVHVPVNPPQARHQAHKGHQYRPMSSPRLATMSGLNLDRLGGGAIGEGDAF